MRLFVVALAIAVLPAGSSAVAGTQAQRELRTCPRSDPVRPRFPAAYVPEGLVGVWKRAGARPGCVSLIPVGSSRPVVVWRPGGTESGRFLGGEKGTGTFGLAPGGRTIAIESLRHGAQYVTIVDTSGVVQWRAPGHALGFTRQGALVIERKAGLLLVTARFGVRLLVPRPRLVAALGFEPDRLSGSLTGQAIAYGDHRVALYGHANDNGRASFRERVLVVDDHGSLTRASPLFKTPGESNSVVGALEWSPDGRLWLANTAPTSTHFDHDHCLDMWSSTHGYARLWCLLRRARLPSPPPSASGHFTSVLWKVDGSTALLNNGYRIDHAGHILPGRIRNLDAAFAVRWAIPRSS